MRDRYLAIVSQRCARPRPRLRRRPPSLTEAVAKNLFKLMAYKDEYEVARLYTDGSFAEEAADAVRRRLPAQIPPRAAAVCARDKVTGRPRKTEYGGWTIHAFRLLARLKFLRGTALDPFGLHRGAQGRSGS